MDMAKLCLCGNMSRMLFDKRHKKKVRVAWMILSVLIIVSMILLYTPLF